MTENTGRTELERAARAAGYTIRFHAGVCKGGAYEGCERLCDDGEWRAWQPRKDDGDAFRLAVHAKIKHFEGMNGRIYAHSAQPEKRHIPKIENRADKLEASRFAIFRAAVEIGRGLG